MIAFQGPREPPTEVVTANWELASGGKSPQEVRRALSRDPTLDVIVHTRACPANGEPVAIDDVEIDQKPGAVTMEIRIKRLRDWAAKRETLESCTLHHVVALSEPLGDRKLYGTMRGGEIRRVGVPRLVGRIPEAWR